MRAIDADDLANKVADLYTEGEEATEGDKVVNDVIDIIDNAPTVEFPEQITIKCDTEEEKQKLLSALRNVKLKAIVEDERQGEWIPVSERLPKESINPHTYDFAEVLATNVWGDVRTYKYGRSHFWHGPQIMDEYVVAWMPLPTPYDVLGQEAEND